jgi:DNA-binding XRE family transcriptional regulator
MSKLPLDFKKVEALRKHMLLTTSNMATLLEVSRMTYYGWVKGKPVRRKNDERGTRYAKETTVYNGRWVAYA